MRLPHTVCTVVVTPLPYATIGPFVLNVPQPVAFGIVRSQAGTPSPASCTAVWTVIVCRPLAWLLIAMRKAALLIVVVTVERTGKLVTPPPSLPANLDIHPATVELPRELPVVVSALRAHLRCFDGTRASLPRIHGSKAFSTACTPLGMHPLKGVMRVACHARSTPNKVVSDALGRLLAWGTVTV